MLATSVLLAFFFSFLFSVNDFAAAQESLDGPGNDSNSIFSPLQNVANGVLNADPTTPASSSNAQPAALTPAEAPAPAIDNPPNEPQPPASLGNRPPPKPGPAASSSEPSRSATTATERATASQQSSTRSQTTAATDLASSPSTLRSTLQLSSSATLAALSATSSDTSSISTDSSASSPSATAPVQPLSPIQAPGASNSPSLETPQTTHDPKPSSNPNGITPAGIAIAVVMSLMVLSFFAFFLYKLFPVYRRRFIAWRLDRKGDREVGNMSRGFHGSGLGYGGVILRPPKPVRKDTVYTRFSGRDLDEEQGATIVIAEEEEKIGYESDGEGTALHSKQQSVSSGDWFGGGLGRQREPVEEFKNEKNESGLSRTSQSIRNRFSGFGFLNSPSPHRDVRQDDIASRDYSNHRLSSPFLHPSDLEFRSPIPIDIPALIPTPRPESETEATPNHKKAASAALSSIGPSSPLLPSLGLPSSPSPYSKRLQYSPFKSTFPTTKNDNNNNIIMLRNSTASKFSMERALTTRTPTPTTWKSSHAAIAPTAGTQKRAGKHTTITTTPVAVAVAEKSHHDNADNGTNDTASEDAQANAEVDVAAKPKTKPTKKKQQHYPGLPPLLSPRSP